MNGYDCPACFDSGPHDEAGPQAAGEPAELVLICRGCGTYIRTGEKVGP